MLSLSGTCVLILPRARHGSRAHELRSPLARLNVALDLAREGKAGDLPFNHMESDLVRLNEMIGRLLTLARLDTATVPEMTSVNLTNLVPDRRRRRIRSAEAKRRPGHVRSRILRHLNPRRHDPRRERAPPRPQSQYHDPCGGIDFRPLTRSTRCLLASFDETRRPLADPRPHSLLLPHPGSSPSSLQILTRVCSS